MLSFYFIAKNSKQVLAGSHLYPIYDNGWGAIDSRGKIIIKPVFKNALNFHGGLADVETDKGYGFIDLNGNWVIPPVFEYTFTFSENLAMVRNEKGKCGYIRKDGKYAVPPIYYYGSGFYEGLAGVAVSDPHKENCACWGYIGKSGNMAIAPVFDHAYPFNHGNGLAIVVVKGKSGVIDKRGQYLLQPMFNDAYFISKDRLVVSGDNNKKGIINLAGQYVIAPVFDDITAEYGKNGRFVLDRAIVKIGEKYGFIDSRGKVVIEPVYELAEGFDPKTGMAGVCLKGKFGFIDVHGKTVIPFQYQLPNITQVCGNEGYRFDADYGLAAVRKDGKWGFIDREGRLVIPYNFDEVGFFSGEGICQVVVYGKRIEGDPEMFLGYIDLKGKYIWKADESL